MSQVAEESSTHHPHRQAALGSKAQQRHSSLSTSQELLIAFFRNSSFPFSIFTSETNILFAKFCSFLVDLASHLFQEPLSDGRGSSESGWLQAFSLPMSLPHLTQCRAENTRVTPCCL